MSFLTGAFRTAAVSTGARAALFSRAAAGTQVRAYSADNESYEEFNARFVKFFENVEDQYELQRGLNNAFAHDLVPSLEVIETAVRASRRVNDFSVGVRIFEGLKYKVENEAQYNQYLEATKPLRDELSIQTKEQLFTS
ncbi:Cytochrome c oxidase subunit 6 [Malassezia sp. CBS 17886]|nr:Cytochrome c oxidase subunit 6 [Malassezia sp. CBS 17886]